MSMKKIADGKTKTLYALDDNRIAMVFKDDVTGTGDEVDPGGNKVVGQVTGKGQMALQQSVYFFQILAQHGIPTHFVSADLDQGILIVRQASWFGLEFIIRFKAYGSFVRRYGRYVKEGADVGTLVEITLKDDERGDPLILDEALDALGILSLEKVKEAKALVCRAGTLIRDDLAAKGLDLVDMKFECGVVDERLVIIDDISTDNMRVMRDGKSVSPQELLAATVG